MKRGYSYVYFILNKVQQNEKASVVHERDAEDKKKYQATIDEYEAVQPKNNQASRPKNNKKRVRSLHNTQLCRLTSQVIAVKKIKPGLHLHTSLGTVHEWRQKRISEVVRDHSQRLSMEQGNRISSMIDGDGGNQQSDVNFREFCGEITEKLF